MFLFPTVEETNYCRLNGKTDLQIGPYSNYGNLSLSGLKRSSHPVSCSWELSAPSSSTFLDLNDVSIHLNDSLLILGITGRRVTILHHSTGPLYQGGLLSLAGFDWVSVLLTLNPIASTSTEDDHHLGEDDGRSFFAYYYNNAAIELLQSSGQMSFPVNQVSSGKQEGKADLSSSLLFLHKWAQEDQLVLLNFTQLPKSGGGGGGGGKVTVNGVQLTAGASQSVSMFLQSRISVRVEDLPPGQQISFRWWLADSSCSGREVLTVGDRARPIHLPSEKYVRRQQSSFQSSSVPVRCAVHYATSVATDRIALHLPTLTGVADLADTVRVYTEQGQLQLELNSLSGVYQTEQQYTAAAENSVLINASSVLVVYESPYVVSPSAHFQPPLIMALSKEDGKLSNKSFLQTGVVD